MNTNEIASGFEIEHKHIKKIIVKNQTEFERHGSLTLVDLPSKGRPIQVYELNDAQAVFLTLLLGNSLAVVKFKSRIVDKLYI